MKKIEEEKKYVGDVNCKFCFGKGEYPSKGMKGEGLINLVCPWCKKTVVDEKTGV